MTKGMERQVVNIEQQIQKDYVSALNQRTLDNLSEKKRLQTMYRSMLDNQIDNNNSMKKSFGNMTGVEKQMNRADLKAWKVYDNSQHSLIPGLNHNNNTNHNVRRSIDATMN